MLRARSIHKVRGPASKKLPLRLKIARYRSFLIALSIIALSGVLRRRCEASRTIRIGAIIWTNAYTREGFDADRAGDYPAAISFFQQALAHQPDNASSIQKWLADARESLQSREQDKITSSDMRQALQDFGEGLTAAPAPSAPAEPEAAVVDARKVPSALPKSIETAIAAAYPGSPAAVTDRVRKGFEAVMNQDWHAAKAWFEDALNREPDNAGLKSLVALADYTRERNKQAAALDYVEMGNLIAQSPADPSDDNNPELARTDAVLDQVMDEELARQLDDFFNKYLPSHPELMVPVPTAKPSSPPAAQGGPDAPADPVGVSGWERLKQLLAPPAPDRTPKSVGAVRD